MRGIFATGATKRTEIHTPLDIVLAHFFVMTVDYSDRVLSNQREEGGEKKKRKARQCIYFISASAEIKLWIKGSGTSKKREKTAVCFSEG